MTGEAPTTYARLLFPGGRRRALTMSFDDGRTHDRRLVAIFNQHGIRGTFNLNSGHLDRDRYITSAEVKSLFAGHEVAVHTVTHPSLPKLTDEQVRREVMDDRVALEALVGYAVRGMAYPGGGADQRVADLLPELGIVYSRLVPGTEQLAMPLDQPCLWNCTCHHDGCAEQAERLLTSDACPALLSVWGHSYEFEDKGNWELIEQFCARVGGRDDVWYATNIEVFDYLAAARALHVSADGSFIANAGAGSVWLDVAGRAVELKPGLITQVQES
ncbi:MAG: polysaccharide deacetylase family protein [Armatimonadetes bacterium]|nr:polysaccharide deacetylase family protein [Armatimonadota bacterium]